MSNTPLTVGRLREILAHYDADAIPHLEGNGPLLQITEKNHIDRLRDGAETGQTGGQSIVVLSSTRL